MKRGRMDYPDQGSVNKTKDISVEGQSPAGKQKGQVCAVGNDDQNYSRQQHLPTSSKHQNVLADRREGSNDRFINDREQLLRILPEELWLLVFEKVDSSDDLERVSNSSPFFRNLLLSQRVNFLFKNVWQILGWKYEDYCFRTNYFYNIRGNEDDDDDIRGNEDDDDDIRGNEDDDDDIRSNEDDNDFGDNEDDDDIGNENDDDFGGNEDVDDDIRSNEDDNDFGGNEDDDDIGNEDDDDIGGNEDDDDIGNEDDDDIGNEDDDDFGGIEDHDNCESNDDNGDLGDIYGGNGFCSPTDDDSSNANSFLSDCCLLPVVAFNPKEGFFEDEAIKVALTLRLVCRSWNRDIDKLYENRDLELGENMTMQKVTSLLSHFEATHGSVTNPRSPFLGRKVTIYGIFPNDGHHRQILNGIHTILDKYGQHFWYCRFAAFDNDVQLACSRYRAMLQRMPQLRKLEIINSSACGSGRSMTSEELEQLKAEINANIFLPLGGLEELIVDSVPLPFIRQLIHNTANLVDHFVLNTPFVSNLKALSVSPCSQEVFEMVTSTEFDWHLTKLDLDLFDSDFTECQGVFNVLESKFGNTLTELRLNLPELASRIAWKQFFEESKRYKLHLPHLTELILGVPFRYLPCLDFLLPMKNSLRVLRLFAAGLKLRKTWTKQVQRKDGGVLKIWNCLQCPLESNIWTLFPSLEKFEFEDVSFPRYTRNSGKFFFAHTRKEWKMKMEN